MPPEISANHNSSLHGLNTLPATAQGTVLSRLTLEQAILQTVAYVDMYDFPLTASEIHRYLIAMPAKLADVKQALNASRLVNSRLGKKGEYFFLDGRSHIVDIRRQRAQASEQLWPQATYYGRLVSALPYVSMVAVTGSLAVDNIDSNADIDYLIVTDVGRLWLCRAMIILLVRQAARRGIILCPNYFLSEQALSFEEHNLYSAHEIVQMVPISGLKVYNRLLEANRWVSTFLPNSGTVPRPIVNPTKSLSTPIKGARWLGEVALRTPPGGWLEQWEMNRKIRRFNQEAAAGAASGEVSEAAFSADYCKGHFDDHSQRTLDEFSIQWKKLADQTHEKLPE